MATAAPPSPFPFTGQLSPEPGNPKRAAPARDVCAILGEISKQLDARQPWLNCDATSPPVERVSSPAPTRSPAAVSLEAPKWFRVKGVPRKPGPWKLYAPKDPLKHSSVHSEDVPDFVKTRSTEEGQERLGIVKRPSIFEVEASPGQTLRGLDHTQRGAREIGEPRKLRADAAAAQSSGEAAAMSVSQFFDKNKVNIVEAFKMFDEDGSGSITVDEFEDGLKSLQTHGLIDSLTSKQTNAMVREMDEDGSGNIDFSEFFHKYGKNQAAGAHVRRHKYGSSGDTEKIQMRRTANKMVGLCADTFDAASRTRPSFVDGHSEHTHARAQASSPAFGRKQGFGSYVSEMALSQKLFLPVEISQERSTLVRRKSPSPTNLSQTRQSLDSSASAYGRGNRPSLEHLDVQSKGNGRVCGVHAGRSPSPVLRPPLNNICGEATIDCGAMGPPPERPRSAASAVPFPMERWDAQSPKGSPTSSSAGSVGSLGSVEGALQADASSGEMLAAMIHNRPATAKEINRDRRHAMRRSLRPPQISRYTAAARNRLVSITPWEGKVADKTTTVLGKPRRVFGLTPSQAARRGVIESSLRVGAP
eukprot:COSAG05_NODE_666_length_8006_cov_12.857595_3_plen_588_part_00